MNNATVRASGSWKMWLGPAFLIFVLVTFFVTPGTTLEKMYMVCFGI